MLLIVKQSTVHWLPIPGKDSQHFRSLHLYVRVPRKTNAVKPWKEQSCTFIEKRLFKISLSSVYWSSVTASGTTAGRSLPAASARQFACAHPSPTKGKNSVSSWQRIDTAAGLARCYMMYMLWAETREHSLSLKQGKMFPPNMVSAAQVVWSLYLLIKKCSKTRVHFYVDKWRSED